MTSPSIVLHSVAIDTPDPERLAAFYCNLAGGRVTYRSDDWVETQYPAGQRLSFQLSPDYVAPTWPANTVPQQAHVDFHVPEYEAAHAHALSLGATFLEDESAHADFRVYADPDGHPFCLCLEQPERYEAAESTPQA